MFSGSKRTEASGKIDRWLAAGEARSQERMARLRESVEADLLAYKPENTLTATGPLPLLSGCLMKCIHCVYIEYKVPSDSKNISSDWIIFFEISAILLPFSCRRT